MCPGEVLLVISMPDSGSSGLYVHVFPGEIL